MTLLQLLDQALNPKRGCRYHAAPAATCQQCFTLAEEQRDVQWARQRKAAHKRYLEAR